MQYNSNQRQDIYTKSKKLISIVVKAMVVSRTPFVARNSEHSDAEP